jgi:hypothetical protein
MDDQLVVLFTAFILVCCCLALVIRPFLTGLSKSNSKPRNETDDLVAQISSVVQEGISNAELEVMVGNLTESEGQELKRLYIEESKIALNSLEDSIKVEKLQQMDLLEKKLFPNDEN